MAEWAAPGVHIVYFSDFYRSVLLLGQQCTNLNSLLLGWCSATCGCTWWVHSPVWHLRLFRSTQWHRVSGKVMATDNGVKCCRWFAIVVLCVMVWAVAWAHIWMWVALAWLLTAAALLQVSVWHLSCTRWCSVSIAGVKFEFPFHYLHLGHLPLIVRPHTDDKRTLPLINCRSNVSHFSANVFLLPKLPLPNFLATFFARH